MNYATVRTVAHATLNPCGTQGFFNPRPRWCETTPIKIYFEFIDFVNQVVQQQDTLFDGTLQLSKFEDAYLLLEESYEIVRRNMRRNIANLDMNGWNVDPLLGAWGINDNWQYFSSIPVYSRRDKEYGLPEFRATPGPLEKVIWETTVRKR